MAWSHSQLRGRIEEVIVDAYGDYEQLGSFACVLDELIHRPVPASVLGQRVELLSVAEDPELTGGLRAKCRHDGRVREVALGDVTLAEPADPELDLTVAAYRRWARGLS